MNRKEYLQRIRGIQDEQDFFSLALKIFRYQANHNAVYKKFIDNLKVKPAEISSVAEIPFLPIEFFKSHSILTSGEEYETVFTSSGTSGMPVSRHFIKSRFFYEQVFTEIFTRFYGPPSEYVILALLPSYLEREGSSLTYMMEKLIGKSRGESAFYLHNHEELFVVLQRMKANRQKTILFGVTYALLDFVADYSMDFPGLIVMETGGMKGKRKEMIREEVHEILKKGFNIQTVHSEYGMTELLSQAYSKGEGKFKMPPWMKVIIRDPYDPLELAPVNSTGGINVIDLANIDSCCFVETQDLGKNYDDGSFEVLGRFDFSDVRGCNLMIS